MKLLFVRSIFFLTFFLMSVHLLAVKYGLIVAISHFDPKYGVPSLHSANDVPFVFKALENQGFKRNDVTVLIDSEATKRVVWNAMQDLINKCKPGDIVWLHFSTHGQKLQDFDGYSTDGYAKSLVMYDSPSKPEPGYHSQRHLTDEDIRFFAKKIRSKLGPKGELVVAIDACHSGLLMRGVDNIRGIEELSEPGYNPSSKIKNTATEGFYSSIIENKEQEATMAPYVFYSACRSEEVCKETMEKTTHKSVGPLSLAISKALTNAQPGETFRQLFARILTEMNITVPNQTPVIVGNGVDKVILGGDIKARAFTYSIKSIISSDTIEMAAGSFAGIYPNTEFTFYKIDDLSHRQGYQKGTVISVEPFSAIVTLQKGGNPISKENARILEALISKKSFGDKTVGVAIDTATTDQEKTWLKDVLKKCPYAELKSIKEKPDLFLRIAFEKKVELLYPDGSLFRATEVNPSDEALAILIQKYGRAQAIKSLQMDNPFIVAEINVQAVPVNTISDTLRINYPSTKGGVITIRVGKDLLNLKITNSGSKVFYLNIIDIEPNGETTPFWPTREMDAAAYKVVPGQSFNQSFPVLPPYGMEGLKIILSVDDINLGVIAASHGTRGSVRGGNNPIEMLFRDEYNDVGTRGTNKAYDNLDAASTFDVHFKIER